MGKTNSSPRQREAAAFIRKRVAEKQAALTLSVDEACAAIPCCRATFYAEIAKGRLRTLKVGGRRRVRPEAIAEYLLLAEREAAA